MRNYIQPGETITLAAPYTLTSGQGLLVGALFGVASGSADLGAEVEAKTGGVYDLDKATGDTFAVGAKVYWDNTNRRCTATATGNSLIGAAMRAASGSDTSVRVRLNGVTI